MNAIFTLGSLFSGIGGLEYGLEMTGRFKTVWQVEQSEYCRKVLHRHWPDALQFEDVRDVGKGNLPAVDVICGGFPCQDISSAGGKAGIRGNRSSLWAEFARIVFECRPRYVVIENVGTFRKRGLREVLNDLATIGYDAEWTSLSACAIGASHPRQRMFLVAYPNGYGQSALSLHAKASGLRQNAVGVWNERDTPPPLVRMVDGLPNGLQRIAAVGNAVVPECARVIGEWLLDIDAELTQGCEG